MKIRAKPYVWVSWITKLIAGEHDCWWAAWFKAHHQEYDKLLDGERESFLSKWTKIHDGMVRSLARNAKSAGYTVRVESQGEWKLSGRAGDLAGKPDVTARKDSGPVRVVDAKSGKRRESDKWQLRIYAYALLRTIFVGQPLELKVLYKDGFSDVDYDPSTHDPEIEAAMRKVTAPEEPLKIPSRSECSRCDIAACTMRDSSAKPEAEVNAW